MLQDLLYLEASDVYTTLVTAHRKFVLRLALSGVLERIRQVELVRIHRSYAVNIHQMNAFSDTEVTVGKQLLPIGRSYKREPAEAVHPNLSLPTLASTFLGRFYRKAPVVGKPQETHPILPLAFSAMNHRYATGLIRHRWLLGVLMGSQFLLSQSAPAQHRLIDSLKATLRQRQSDTARANAFYDLANSFL